MTPRTTRSRFLWLLNNTLNRLTSETARSGHGPLSLIRASDANLAPPNCRRAQRCRDLVDAMLDAMVHDHAPAGGSDVRYQLTFSP